MNTPSLEAVFPASGATRPGVVQRGAMRIVAAASSAVRGVGSFLAALGGAADELRRMADDCETTRPEMAAHLRRAVRQGWGW